MTEHEADAPAATAPGRARRLLPTLALLGASLAALTEGVSLLTGFGLHALDPRPHLGDGGLEAAGVVVAAVAAGAAVGNLAWLLVTSAGEHSASGVAGTHDREDRQR
ncbi:hypothetical protein ACF1AO_19695 [Streptomyces longwoodensis]|uniref:hypothetical protein n=1 Tax=Streptomyces longwoodensis TaxID=68231 RepID=UPI0036FB6999